MAARRAEGVGSRSIARGLSGIKSFFAHCERQGLLASETLALIRAPKKPDSLPKALTVTEARAALDATESLESRPWVAARDTAIIALLYGAGLRIAEALSVTRAALDTESLRVSGKGGKTRLVPLIAPVRQAV